VELGQQLSFIQFVNALHSKQTKDTYTRALNDFLGYAKIDPDALIELDPKKLQTIIIAYIVDMKDKRHLSPNAMRVKLNALKTFLLMNDYVNINWTKVKRYCGEFYLKAEDRPYTREEIGKMVDATHSLRDKAILLVFASTGIRREAITLLKLKHLKKINKYNIFSIDVYKRAKEEYYTFCTPECRKAIEEYLNWRERLGEKLTPESPLFRKEFDSRFSAPRGRKVFPITTRAIRHLLDTLRKQTGIVQTQHMTETSDKGYRSEIMQAHGLRKFFETTCINSGMEVLYVERLMGHNTGLMKSYFKPKMNEILEGNDRMRGYIHIMNDLTISEENRLKVQVQQLSQEKDALFTDIDDKIRDRIQAALVQHGLK
jgi:integrase